MAHPGLLLKNENIFAGKELGQNFIADPGSAMMIVEKSCLNPDDTILEIGPGLGALTVCCAAKVKRVIAVEKDSRLIPLLKNELARHDLHNVEIINEDILRVEIEKLAGTKKLVIMGNLPYNISSQILLRLVSSRHCISKAFLMFQKEMAQRITALPGTKDYNRLAAVIQYCAKVRNIADLKPTCFFPKPEVDSRVIEIVFMENPLFSPEMETFHFDVIKAAFSKRRKTLKNSLFNTGLQLTKDQVSKALAGAMIDPGRRAETLTVPEFVQLSKALWSSCKEDR